MLLLPNRLDPSLNTGMQVQSWLFTIKGYPNEVGLTRNRLIELAILAFIFSSDTAMSDALSSHVDIGSLGYPFNKPVVRIAI